MENKSHALAAGIFVALITALVLALAAWLTRDTGVRDTYEISTKETVTGLQEQAPVRFRGVDVGKVSGIGFDPKAQGSVLVRMEIDRDTPLTRDTFATLSYQGVTGLAFIQLADDGKPAPRLAPNDEVPPRIPLRPGLLSRLEEKGEVIIDQVQQVAERVNKLLSDENQRRLATALDNIGEAAGSTSQLAKRIDHTVTQRIDPAIAEVTVTMKSAQRAADQVGAAANQFSLTAQRLNGPGGALDRVGEGTDAFAAAAENLNATALPRFNRAMDTTNRTMRTVDRAFTELLDNPQMLIYGEGGISPGPGEPGFRAPGVRR
ncbi:MlaD family protein [Ramlibacter pallidus]|uniref:MCE family protein n=1 Tax=Ramlibacter pallidus TaxID=2780087 RepID=A0ABR9RZS8_9BURK|nr:MlaD family protein [Ramlibacter pallidus]MBE7366719.1 MCE family protein [Ramlibacter pallidus]